MVSSNTLTNIKMANAIKNIVSKKKKRYKEDGFDLDLSYINKNIIAMGYPAKNFESFYRNPIEEVMRFLIKKHNNNYKIYNLCVEKHYQYDHNKFQQCAQYPFSDHNPPSIELIQSFCSDVYKFLSADSKNVAAIHCKAGKGRTGTMICCYLLHSGKFETAADALTFYGQARTTNEKGVTIPSQRRYVNYYASLLKMNRPYTKVAMNICEIKIYNFSPRTFTYSIVAQGQKVHSEQLVDLKRTEDYISIKLDRCILLVGDVKIDFFSSIHIKKQKIFHFWFNTFFVNEISNSDPEGNVIFELNKSEIDEAHKDKQHSKFSDNLKIQVTFQRIPQSVNIVNRPQQTNGIHNEVRSRDANSRLINRINNNASANNHNNNNINQHSSNHTVAEPPQLQPSQSSDSAMFRNIISGNRMSTNDNMQRRSDYQTTSDESTSPESSSDSSAEDWESESLVRYRLLSEPELSSLLKTTLSNGSLQSSKGHREDEPENASSSDLDVPDNLIREQKSPRLLATDDNDNNSHNRNNNNLVQT